MPGAEVGLYALKKISFVHSEDTWSFYPSQTPKESKRFRVAIWTSAFLSPNVEVANLAKVLDLGFKPVTLGSRSGHQTIIQNFRFTSTTKKASWQVTTSGVER